MTNNVIYAYKKRSTGKIVYVGQTVNLTERDKQHMRYDPFNINNKEYNYTLSRGVRKYGQDEYELIILQKNVSKENLNEREKYWIQYYNTYWDGYNQTPGGSNPTKPVFTNDKINQVIQMLRDQSYSYKDIIAKTGISMTHIYNINTGRRRRQKNINYPIRPSNTKGTKGLKFSQQQIKKIHEEILNTKKSFKQIGKEFQCSPDTISDINRGKTKSYLLPGYIYPLREKVHSYKKQK